MPDAVPEGTVRITLTRGPNGWTGQLTVKRLGAPDGIDTTDKPSLAAAAMGLVASLADRECGVCPDTWPETPPSDSHVHQAAQLSQVWIVEVHELIYSLQSKFEAMRRRTHPRGGCL